MSQPSRLAGRLVSLGRRRPGRQKNPSGDGLTRILIIILGAAFACILLLAIVVLATITAFNLSGGSKDSTLLLNPRRIGGILQEGGISAAAAAKTKSPLSDLDEEEEEEQEQQQQHRMQQWRSFFSGIVLVINFKSVERAWKELDFLRLIYSRVFDTIVAVAPEAIKELNVVGVADSEHRHLSYAALPAILANHTKAVGFLWMDDDVVLNYWRIAEAAPDRSNVWYINTTGDGILRRQLNADEMTRQSGTTMSMAVAAHGFSHRQEFERLGQAFLSMPEFLRGQYERSVWPDRYVALEQRGYSTVFYLPQRFADTASLHVLPNFVTQAVPVQVAIPVMLFSLDYPKNFDGVGFQDAIIMHKQLLNPEVDYRTNVTAYGPWELQETQSRPTLLASIASVDPLISKRQ